jgi:hypothetical protein
VGLALISISTSLWAERGGEDFVPAESVWRCSAAISDGEVDPSSGVACSATGATGFSPAG